MARLCSSKRLDFQTQNMNATTPSCSNELRCCSFNLHGFSNGLPMLQALCNDHEIILVQEHWLHAHELNRFTEMFTDFNCYGLSSMNDKLSAGILVGRPYMEIL